MLIDSGASCNAIDSNTWETLKSNVKLNKCDRKVYAYRSKSPLHVIGKFDTKLRPVILKLCFSLLFLLLPN